MKEDNWTFYYTSPTWQVQLANNSDFIIQTNGAPNTLHRLFQKWCLGIIWTKLD